MTQGINGVGTTVVGTTVTTVIMLRVTIVFTAFFLLGDIIAFLLLYASKNKNQQKKEKIYGLVMVNELMYPG